MNKILQSASTGELVVARDGAMILKSIVADNAAAKVQLITSKVQDEEGRDRTTNAAVSAAELLREAMDSKILDGRILDGGILNREVLDGEVLDGEVLGRRNS